MNQEIAKAYWRANLRVIGVLLGVWALSGLVFGVFMAERLNTFSLGGAPFGFWMAQQGAIFIFVVIIFVYAWVMERIDHRYRVDDENE
jgi:putative solute:sodium symporter small subunit